MVEHFDHQFLQAPTVDPEIPSLVATDSTGRVIGFLGANVISMRFDRRAVRAVATGPLFTEPDARAVSVLLLRSLLAGPQELTFSDKHNLEAHRLFSRLGARVVHPRCVWWEVNLRRAEHWVMSSAPSPRRFLTPALRALARIADRYASHRSPKAPNGAAVAAEPLTPDLVASHVSDLVGWARLRPEYDTTLLRWRLEQLAQVRRLGTLRALALREKNGTVLGWFIVLVPRGRIATVVQVIAREGKEETVLEGLLAAAYVGGAVAVRGRLEPELAFALTRIGCELQQRACLLAHTTCDEIWSALTSDRSVLTLLDGEPWLAEMHDG